MKPCHLFTVAYMAALLIAPHVCAAEQEMRDAMTSEQLYEKHAEAAKNYPTAVHRAKEAPDPSKENPPQSIVSQSDFLSFNGRSTLVPKQAIIHIPANLQDRVKFTPGAALMTWGEFFAVNRNWITTVEITRAQAEGNVPLAEETSKQVGKSTSLVVATYKGGPITLLPPKAPAPAPADPKADPKAAATAKGTTASTQKKP